MNRLFVLVMLMSACASAKPKPDGDGESELLVWNAQADETLWLKDGAVVAKAEGIFVAGEKGAWQVMLVPRSVMDHHACSDGFDPDRKPIEPTETSIMTLVARPLDEGEPVLLAAQLDGDSTTCGVPGAPPSLIGGIGTRVSFIWSEGRTTSAAIGEESSPMAVVHDLASGRVAIPGNRAYDDTRKAVFADLLANEEDECGGPEDFKLSGPSALRIQLDDGVIYTGAVIADNDGATCDATGFIPVEDALGLGSFPVAAVHAAEAAWDMTDALGVSWVPDDMKVRVQLQRAFGL